MTRDLRGKSILLTGASRGIGLCVAQRLARQGARLVLSGRSEKDLMNLATRLNGEGAEVYAIPADLTNSTDRATLVRESVERLGGLDVLINNAGLCSFGEFSSSTEEILRRIMEINFFVPAEMIRLCLPHLSQSSRQPAVVNVASICGRRGIPSFPEHCASKFALVGLTEALRGELVRFDVNMLLVVPGLVRADDLGKHLIRNEGKIYLNWAGAQHQDRVARAIVRSLRWNFTETVAGWVALQIHRLQRCFPWILDLIMLRKVRRFQERANRPGCTFRGQE